MPVWAAVTASMSLPFFTEPFKFKAEWGATTSYDLHSLRELKDFLGETAKASTKLYTGDVITKLPLEPITN